MAGTTLPLRILHISSAQAFGGGERNLVDLVNALAARGHEVYVAVRPTSPLRGELTLPKENVLSVPLRNALDAKSASALSSFVRRRKIEIVHAHMARDYPLAAYATRRNRDSRLLITRHVLFPMSRLHQVTLLGVARVIAVSEGVGRQLRAQGLVVPEKITVVHNGIDVSRIDNAMSQFSRKRFCRRWDLPEETLLVGSVGSLNPLKGHEDFLRAAAQIKDLLPGVFFVIAGIDSSATQENRAHLERLIQTLGLADCVRLIGWMDDLPSLFRALDVFVSASHTESFGLAIAEALACGTAVVTTETEGAKEIVQNGETGLLVPVGDVNAMASSVVALLKDREERERIGKLAHDAVRLRFSLDRMVDATEKIYRESLQ